MTTITLPNEKLLPEVASLLMEGHKVTLRVKGQSMLPFIIGDRDSVILQKPERLKTGDIVLAEIAPRTFFLHRIIKIENKSVTLMGDGNIRRTEVCHINNISGCVSAIIRDEKVIDYTKNRMKAKAYLWHKLLPLRRYLLAIYKRTIY